MNKSIYKIFMASLVAFAVISCQAIPEETPMNQELFDEVTEENNGGENARKFVGNEFGAFLIGSEEVSARPMPLISPGAGAASFTLSPDGKVLNYEIRVFNTTDIVFGHLHLAPAGQNGGIIVDILGAKPGLNNGLIASGEIRDADIKLLQNKTVAQLVEEIKAGKVYVNIHTKINMSGELRGQVSVKQPGAEKNFAVQLSGANEVPAIMTKASGLARFQFNTSDTNLTFQVNVAGIATDILFSHIHLGRPGINGGVVITLRGDNVQGPFNGVYAKGVITADMLENQLKGADLMILKEAFRSGLAYVNIHSEEFKSGELRGNF